ncbi:homeobox protein HB9 [Sarotherodon galilaeus]
MEFSLFISLFLRIFLGRKRDSKRRRGREREREREGLSAPPVGGETRAGTNTRSDPLYTLSREQGITGCKLKAKPGLYIVFYS